MTIEESIVEVLRTLPPDKQADVLKHALELRRGCARPPRKSGRGLWKDLNVSLSANEIDQMRDEMWRNFPRDDI